MTSKLKYFDGTTHINVYSKGRTELGRFLSNFEYAPIETTDGHFDSIEGYWYWISTHDDKLRFLSGWEAKEYGRSKNGKDWIDAEEFKNKTRSAIYIKLQSNPVMFEKLIKNKLPLKHYYVYGDKVINVRNAQWFIDYLSSFMEYKGN